MKKKTASGIMLTLILIGMLTLAFDVQRPKAQGTVRFYVKDPTDGDNVYSGRAVGVTFPVQVWIDSPHEWTGTEEGIVLFTVSVRVDPTVLEVVGAQTVPDRDEDGVGDGFLERFAAGYESITLDAPEVVNKTAGIIWGFANGIAGWGILGVGAGGSGILAEFLFKSKSDTLSSPIDLIESEVIRGFFTADARYTNPKRETYNADVVEDGYYNHIPGTAASDDPNSLSADHNSSRSNYSTLEGNSNSPNPTYNNLESKLDTLTSDLITTRNLSYIFIITTVIFAATTVCLSIRKPKAKPEPETT